MSYTPGDRAIINTPQWPNIDGSPVTVSRLTGRDDLPYCVQFDGTQAYTYLSEEHLLHA